MTEAEWLAGNDIRGMLRHLGTSPSERKWLLFAVHCCRRIWDRFTDPRTRQVVECAELLAEGLATPGELERAYEAAVAAWREAMELADRAEQHARERGLPSKYDSPEYVEARRNAWGADPGQYFFYRGAKLADQVSAQIRGLAGDVSNMAFFAVSPNDNPERMWQGSLLHEMFGNPFRPVTFSPDWRTTTAVGIARQMYESRDFSAAPILADALQDAGCDNDEILAHCRDEKQVHYRGWWLADLVLDKS